jgi:phage shock protein C
MNATLPRPDTSTYVPPRAETTVADSPLREPRLVRPSEGRRLGGVCAGLADKYGWSRTTVRAAAVVSILLPGPQVLAYIVAWFVIPDAADGAPILDVDADKAAAEVVSVVRR